MSAWSKFDKSRFHGRTNVNSVWLLRLCLITVSALAIPLPACAGDGPTFDELLTRAQTQAASGHRWSPPGNNMTETVSRMMDLISTASPKQLADLSALLESDPAHPQTPAQAAQPLVTEAAVEPTAVAPTADAPRPVLTPDRPAPAPTIAPKITALPDTPKPPSAPVVMSPGPRAAELFARGQEAERQGDVSGARRFYATAANQGSATAARSLGRLYDPGYLKQTALGGIDPDPALARHWYERAVAMGDAQATPLLQALAAR